MSEMRFFALSQVANRQPLEVSLPSKDLSDYYSCHVFNRKTMQKWLPKEAYEAVVAAIEEAKPISRHSADLIANAMKSWAKQFGVTHYTHWFQPLTTGDWLPHQWSSWWTMLPRTAWLPYSCCHWCKIAFAAC